MGKSALLIREGIARIQAPHWVLMRGLGTQPQADQPEAAIGEDISPDTEGAHLSKYMERGL